MEAHRSEGEQVPHEFKSREVACFFNALMGSLNMKYIKVLNNGYSLSKLVNLTRLCLAIKLLFNTSLVFSFPFN